MVRIFHEVRRNSYSIATNFGGNMSHFNKPEIIGLDQSILSNKNRSQAVCLATFFVYCDD